MVFLLWKEKLFEKFEKLEAGAGVEVEGESIKGGVQSWVIYIYIYKFLADTCPFLGPLVPLFWISGDVSSGFQSQSGFCLIRYFCRGECNIHSPRFTSGATLANLLAASVQPVTSSHACEEVGLGSDSNVQSHGQKTNALPLCQRPGCGSYITLRVELGPQYLFVSMFCYVSIV